ncbi:hypothetical protein AB0K74_10630 [Streptomyces sp. NPDC056159]|uniref:hypothetical protein n=1 Tax=Streptomyces sp. NPDC056159 TaxID=3155537 RepID=UPI003429D3FD
MKAVYVLIRVQSLVRAWQVDQGRRGTWAARPRGAALLPVCPVSRIMSSFFIE